MEERIMKIVLFDVKSYDKKHFEAANKEFGYEITYYEPALNVHTAVMAKGSDVVCPFVNCTVDKDVIDILKECQCALRDSIMSITITHSRTGFQ